MRIEGSIKLHYFVHQFIQDVVGNEILKDAENAYLSRVSCVLLRQKTVRAWLEKGEDQLLKVSYKHKDFRIQVGLKI